MALAQSTRLQLRLIACHAAGVMVEAVVMPHLLAAGLSMDHVVLAWVAGVVLFLIFALLGGVIWRRSIMAQPLRWGLASPPAIGLTMYLLLRALSGFDSSDARLALEVSLVGTLCALFSSAFFLAWTHVAPKAPSGL